jgi:hypothetical protein
MGVWKHGPLFTVREEVVCKAGGQLFPVRLEEFDEDVVGRRDHDVLPEPEIRDGFPKGHTPGLEPFNHPIDIRGLNAEVVDGPPSWVFGRLIVEVEPALSDLDEHVSRTGHLRVQGHFTAETLHIEVDAPGEVRGKQVNVVKVTWG